MGTDILRRIRRQKKKESTCENHRRVEIGGLVALAFFLFQVFVISLSGVMAPGPVTAATIAIGARNRYAGILVAIGHGAFEFPLMFLIILGVGRLLKLAETQIVIGLVGGALLLVMAVQMLISLKTAGGAQAKHNRDRPVLAGVILSAGNPYFLLWWATVGLTYTTRAREMRVIVFVLFSVVHWLCDCIWLGALSWASFKSWGLLGEGGRRIVLLICSAALLVFGLIFIYNAADILIKK